jgi:hypothetical protein
LQLAVHPVLAIAIATSRFSAWSPKIIKNLKKITNFVSNPSINNSTEMELIPHTI